jgi:hypothetical protein
VKPRRPPPPPDAPVDGLIGSTGSLSGHAVLGAVRGWLESGTLALAQGQDVGGVRVLRGVALMALAERDVTARHMLGRFAGLAGTNLDLHAVMHAPSALPRLPSVAPTSDLGAARALPRFVAGVRLLPGVSDVKPLLDTLGNGGWHGALLGRSDLGSAMALLLDGRVVAANGRRAGAPLERQDALRLLQRMAHEDAPDALQMVPLEPRSAAAVAGYALGRVHRGDATQHTGIVAGTSGFTFVHRGEPYLELLGTAHDLDLEDAEAGDAPRRYAALDEPAAPAVPLPAEPPGWEAQSFVLTLRGRDALNPMTELWMRFRSTYGAPGQRLLEVLSDGATLEAVASALDTPLEELRPWLQRLESEGLVRVGGRQSIVPPRR